MNPTVSKLRQIIHELRLSNPEKMAVGRLPLTHWILSQYRKYQFTQKQYCKDSEEMAHLADTYATYLRSQRQWGTIHGEYHAKGERSTAETAKMVGFKLPHDPK